MFPTLDPSLVILLRCPLCKAELTSRGEVGFACSECATCFPFQPAQDTGGRQVLDFRIQRPGYCTPHSVRAWQETQVDFERWTGEQAEVDDTAAYEAEIDSVVEIYRDEFHLAGDVLDIGGHQGRLRHFLGSDTTSYLSLDPYLDVFAGLGSQPGLLAAYPKLREPCNFMAGHAEHLPLAPRSFDWVHMRSVVDHFEDPYVAIREARRVLRPGGHVLIGVAIEGARPSSTVSPSRSRLRAAVSRHGVAGTAKLALARARHGSHADHHVFHWDREHLLDLVESAELRVVKEHWQKPPFDMCLYFSATRVD